MSVLMLRSVSRLIFLFVSTIVVLSQPLPPLAEIKAKAERGDPSSQTKLADAYAAKFDFENARQWYEKAATQNDRDAQYRLGYFYLTGKPAMNGAKGIDKDPKLSFFWFRKSAYQGDGYAQRQLGLAYREGQGVNQDKIEAYKWFSLAMKAGEPTAKEYLERLILEFTTQQVQEGERGAQSFVKTINPPDLTPARLPSAPAPPAPPPQKSPFDFIWVQNILVSGTNRMAIVNDQLLYPGSTVEIVLDGKKEKVRCLKLDDHKATLMIQNQRREIPVSKTIFR
jgi:hypothetical protein